MILITNEQDPVNILQSNQSDQKFLFPREEMEELEGLGKLLVTPSPPVVSVGHLFCSYAWSLISPQVEPIRSHP